MKKRWNKVSTRFPRTDVKLEVKMDYGPNALFIATWNGPKFGFVGLYNEIRSDQVTHWRYLTP